MEGALYLHDAYLRSFDAKIVAVDGSRVALDRTAFYPTGGGQPCDTGTLTVPGSKPWRVVSVEKGSMQIAHVLEGTDPPPVGTGVIGALDWDRRYRHMRYHTALHILSGAAFRRFGAGITGGQIYEDRARMDFSIPEFDRGVADELVASMNEVVKQARAVAVREVSRAQFEAEPTLVRVAAELLPETGSVRLIDIVGFDVQADGGTHVASTAEVGHVRLQKVENKGSRNKRLYVTLDEPLPSSVEEAGRPPSTEDRGARGTSA